MVITSYKGLQTSMLNMKINLLGCYAMLIGNVLMAQCLFETSGTIYQSTWCNIPEELDLH
jgi:hypothetical protein